jgi:DegV family protein with EDD domain
VTNIQVILDSTANAQPQWLLEHPNVHIVSLTVQVADKEYAEDQLSAEQLFVLMKETAAHPKTSQPAPGVFQRLYERLLILGGDIVVITLSEALSGTVRSAGLARDLCSQPQHIHIVDSATTAIGLLAMAEQVVAAAQQNRSVSEIISRLGSVVKATHTYFVPGTLDFLHQGGRIGGASALFGSILQIRPVLYLVAGKVTVLEKVRTRTRAVDKMIDEVHKFEQLAYLGVVQIAALDEAEAVAAHLVTLFPQVPVTIVSGGSVLAAHLGPGLVGVVLQERV